ncbi:hypothetical protein C8Q72DRAFT_793638 [Fomitopsis betulina]|nr:hypothetical protein C8Q72DRAFT_793638 [Fomitopsis betulina]
MSRAASPMHTDDNADLEWRAPPTSGAVVGAGLYTTARPPPQQAVPVTMSVTTSEGAPAGGPPAANMAPATQYQFGTVSGIKALFLSRTVHWIIREPMVPTVHHTPGTCAVCDDYGWLPGGRNLVEQAEKQQHENFRLSDELLQLRKELKEAREAVDRRNNRVRKLEAKVTKAYDEADYYKAKARRLEVVSSSGATQSSTARRQDNCPRYEPPTQTATTSRRPEAAAPSSCRAEAPPTSQTASRPAATGALLKKIPNIMTDWDNYDSADDLPDSDKERKKIQKQKDRAFHTGHGMRPSEDTDRGATPRPSAVVEPATPEGWPTGVHPPTSTASSRAGRWADFVPRLAAQADSIMRAAYAGDCTAEQRVKDLIRQSQEYAALRAVDGIARLLELWRNPAKRPALPSIQPPGAQNLNYGDDDEELHHLRRAVEASHEEHRQREAAPPAGTVGAGSSGSRLHGSTADAPSGSGGTSQKRRATSPSKDMPAAPPTKKVKRPQPLADTPATEWVEWYLVYRMQTPPSIRWEADRPRLADVSALRIMHRLAPTGDRHQWDIMTGRLFSIEGLYRHIVRTGQYLVGDGRADVSYPWPGANITIFKVARWFARMGYHPLDVRFLEEYFLRRRNEQERRGLDEGVPFSSYPTQPGDVRDGDIPAIHQLAAIPPTVHIPINKGDVIMDAGQPGATLPTATEGQPDGPSGAQ